jgi:hypothetical protein
MLSVRLDETDMDWLNEYAEKYKFYYRGKPCFSKVIKHIIKTEKDRERGLQPISEDASWKRFSEYAELVERGYSHLEAAQEIGLLTSPPEMEKAYAERYIEMKGLEKKVTKEKVFSILRPYLAPERNKKTLEYLDRLTAEPASWIADRVEQSVDQIVESFRYWLLHPESRPRDITEEGLRQFLE